MRVIYRKIRHAPYLYIKRNVEKVWGARYTLGARYLSKNTVNDSCCVRPLTFITQQEFKNTRLEVNLCTCQWGTSLLKHLDTNTCLTVRSKTRIKSLNGNSWHQVTGLWGRKKRNYSGQESGRILVTPPAVDLRSHNPWCRTHKDEFDQIKDNECLFYEKTVISTLLWIIRYGLICQNKAHVAISGQDCTAFLSWGIPVVYVTIS